MADNEIIWINTKDVSRDEKNKTITVKRHVWARLLDEKVKRFKKCESVYKK